MSWPCRPAGLPVGIVLGARGHARPALCRAGQRLRGRHPTPWHSGADGRCSRLPDWADPKALESCLVAPGFP